MIERSAAAAEHAATYRQREVQGRTSDIGLPAQLATLLRRHHAEQDAERSLARQLWHEEGWVFTTQTGKALNPMTDYKQWKDLLKAAGLREARLHDARHTAATVLLIRGQPERTVMSLMGWSTTDMDSLAAILPLVEDGLLTHDGGDDIDLTELKAALADLRAALSEPTDGTSGDAK